MFVNFAAALDVNIDDSDLVAVTRKQTTADNTGLPRSIIITFKHPQKRTDILLKKKTQLSTKIFNVRKEEERPIYIAEQLTNRRQHFSKVARDVKRAGIIKFVLVKNGNIFIRKRERAE